MKTNVPNLDTKDADELWKFWQQVNNGPRRIARILFPEKPRGYVRATQHLANYACNKSVAMKCRLDGRIQSALTYEHIADRIYNDLPEFAKW